MRHAVIILWHRNIRNLSRLAEYFNDKDIDVFIHIDRRADYSSEVEAGIREEFPDIAVYRKFRVRWGGINILRAEIFLINEALRRGEYGYVHLLSGEDFPLYPLSFFKTFFERNEGKEFLEYHSFPTPKWNGGSTERLAQWWPNDLFDVGTPELRKRVMKFVSLQRRIGISRKRLKYFTRLYGGSNWLSITGACANHISYYLGLHKHWLRRLRFTFASDEICFPTIIMNSPYSRAVTGNNLRYLDWSKGLPSPAFMTEKHIQPAVNSGALFARKVGVGISDLFCEVIKGRIRAGADHSVRRIIYVKFYEESYNGTSTFLKQLTTAFCDCYDFSFVVLELCSPVEEAITGENGVTIYRMPYGAEEAFGYLINQGIIEDSESNIFLQNSSPASTVLSKIKLSFPKSRSVYIIHDFIWLSFLMGDVERYIDIISQCSQALDKKTRDFFMALYQDCRKAASVADAVVALNPETARLLEAVFHIPSGKINLIRNGMKDISLDYYEEGMESKKGGEKDETKNRVGEPSNKLKFLFCGRFTLQKGFDTLMGAIREILSDFQETEFICCGGEYDGLPAELRSMTVGFGDSVRWEGFVERETIVKLINEADAVVFPSRYEQSGYVAIEAKGAGKPLIVSDGFGMDDLAADGCALTFRSGDVRSLVSCLNSFIKMTYQERKTLGLLSRIDYEKRYRLDIMKGKYLELFSRIATL